MAAPTKDLAPLAEPTKRLKVALRTFETAFGGRDAMVDALDHAQLTSEQTALAYALADPANRSKGLAKIVAEAGFTLGQFLQLMATARGAKSMMAAWDQIHQKTPAVAQDFMSRALPHQEPCQSCLGEGVTFEDEPSPCPICRGKGLVPKIPTLKRQELALQAVGILKAKQGPVQQNVLKIEAPRNSPQFRAETDKLLFAEAPKPVEAEVVTVVAEGSAGTES
jgi:hypothetical protein